MQVSTRSRSYYICKNCRAEHIRWAGRCYNCKSWNSLEEVKESLRKEAPDLKPLVALNQIELSEAKRLPTNIDEVDRVLGGGLMPGALLLLAGEPGVGKSTLFLKLAQHSQNRIFYFSGEETMEQVALRAKRLGLSGENIFVRHETSLEAISNSIIQERPQIALIDSIQTLYRRYRGIPAGPGQLREAAMTLLEAGRASNSAIIASGHITKDGAVAGPRLLEHIVDVVLYFDRDRLNQLRLLRALKNRFGPVGEMAVFEMGPQGLSLAGELYLPERGKNSSGRTISVMLTGSRPIGIEVQALVVRNPSGPIRRMAEGLDNRRLVLISAVLEKFLKIRLSECDVFANLTGGLSCDEPALDLAQCMAILSSYNDLPTAPNLACIGEVGLGGEVRPIDRLAERIAELTRLGFNQILLPGNCPIEQQKKPKQTKLKLQPISHVSELLSDFQNYFQKQR